MTTQLTKQEACALMECLKTFMLEDMTDDALQAYAKLRNICRYDIFIVGESDNKVARIKVIRHITKLGLKESKDLCDANYGPIALENYKVSSDDLAQIQMVHDVRVTMNGKEI